jgi:hypothetical protein
MSSSRSIAAARNRRAGEQQPQAQINRPGTSIAGQPAFSQQPQLKRNLTAQNPTPNVTSDINNTPTKLSISDAIGLITLRLGRVEQILIDLEQNGGFTSGSSIPDNTHLIDKSVFNSIINRLDSLERKEKETSSNQQTSKLETEIRDIKDLLMSQILKYEKFTSETNKKLDEFKETIEDHKKIFDDFDNAIIEIEKNQELLNSSITSQITNNNTDTDTDTLNNDNVNTLINDSSNLKSVIEQELADSV